ncbi:response regulator [Magnetospirillum sp. UT-4]|uniref:response regulator n=1 Tax=Magnetospirillum sp. UT-4 TaxID=2681467 RepID=UPI001381CBDC|nr:response regulator [Magnetospirillum sp. UT-4]CAA7616571.1 CheY-like receiver protein [Magnetospirillum sp. UT-4]
MTARTVLVVDDSLVARMLTRHLIETARPGWTVVEATCGEDALALVAGAAPDCILLDVNMPGIGGLEAARRLREVAPLVPVALLTANIQDAIRQRAGELGVGFMSKPAAQAELVAFLDGVAA